MTTQLWLLTISICIYLIAGIDEEGSQQMETDTEKKVDWYDTFVRYAAWIFMFSQPVILGYYTWANMSQWNNKNPSKKKMVEDDSKQEMVEDDSKHENISENISDLCVLATKQLQLLQNETNENMIEIQKVNLRNTLQKIKRKDKFQYENMMKDKQWAVIEQ
eukprot:384827_1